MQGKALTMTRRALALALAVCFVLVSSTARAAAVAWGDRGEDVRRVQEKLIKYGYMQGPADGVFGQDTYDAVVRFQRRYGIAADGVVGEETARLLGVTLSGGQTSGAGKSSAAAASNVASEVYLLARVVHGEARGESYKGKVAVAAVILNRVKSASFPNTIAGVVYQPGAFDAVADGQANLTPDDESLKAARDAMNGWDPTNGCLYYYNPQRATAAWIYTREVRVVIGKHYFCV